METMLHTEHIINHSGFDRYWQGVIPSLRKGYYWISNKQLSGDAPKRFVHIYQYGEGRKASPSEWPSYLAKVGHKWYPNESITEHLLNRIGKTIGLKMADSQLVLAGRQIRFLSRYFLSKNQILVHGAEIYAGYLEDENMDLVHEIEEQELSRELLTFQVTLSAIRERFPQQAEDIIYEFVRMLTFDALIGNNDRHFYNWGVIDSGQQHFTPVFSPVYDTARALLWNVHEEKLESFLADTARLQKYVVNSHPKIGWDQHKNLNHFQLVQNIYTSYPEFRFALINMIDFKHLDAIFAEIDENFGLLISNTRRMLIKRVLTERWEQMNRIV